MSRRKYCVWPIFLAWSLRLFYVATEIKTRDYLRSWAKRKTREEEPTFTGYHSEVDPVLVTVCLCSCSRNFRDRRWNLICNKQSAEEKAEIGKDCDLPWISWLVDDKIGIWNLGEFPLTLRGKRNNRLMILYPEGETTNEAPVAFFLLASPFYPKRDFRMNDTCTKGIWMSECT